MPEEKDRSGGRPPAGQGKPEQRQQQEQGQRERGFGRAPGQADPAQGGSGDRQQGGGGQSYQTDKPGQHAGRQRNGGQDSH